jgi:Ser/Thr protein kinase RdoA (MazF antagonist)
MRLEPELDVQKLQVALACHYGLQLRDLVYIPQGEVSYNYILDAVDRGGDGQRHRYLLKILDSSRLAGLAAERLQVAFPLLRELRQRDMLTKVPVPCFTLTGQPTGALGDFTLAMLLYVEGENPSPETLHRPDIWAQLASHVAHLHAATDEVRTPCPYVETFDLPFARPLVDSMQALRQLPFDARQGLRDLRDLLLPRLDEVMALLARTRALARVARQVAARQVLCHTDIHPMNLLIDDSGVLTLLDWEGVKLASAEHDLFAFNGDDFPAFLHAYWRAGGVRQLSPDLFGFYFYRRNLEDLTDWLVRILYENESPEQDAADLAGIEQDCLDGWPVLSRAVDRVRSQLAQLAVGVPSSE